MNSAPIVRTALNIVVSLPRTRVCFVAVNRGNGVRDICKTTWQAREEAAAPMPR